MSELSITVGAPVAAPQAAEGATPRAPRPLAGPSQKQKAYDEMRRPQAASVYRMLKARHELGASWRELWALGEGNDQWDVGPIIVWLRTQKVEVMARYDPIAGETRFYLIPYMEVGGD